MPAKKNKSSNTLRVSPFSLWFIRLLSLVGVGVMVYLSKLHFDSSITAGSVCELGEGLSCGAVNASVYSEILGIPIAFLGIGFFSLVFLLSFKKPSVGLWQFLFLFTLFNLVPSLYLTTLELTVINSICVFCEFSKVLMFLILLTSGYELYRSKKMVEIGPIVFIIIVGLISVFIMYTLQKSSGESNLDLTELAQCMTDEGVVMYGSFTCIPCARQRQYFGEAFEHVVEIECNPKGENPETERCVAKGIEHTPTFIIERDGEEFGRIDGFQNAQTLAEFAGCEDTLK